MRHANRHRQGGFTLVELSVVLVIVGLLLGAVFAGQELIKNAQATRLKNQVKNIESMAQNFRDQRGRYPGDCNDDGIINIHIDSLGAPEARPDRADYLSTASSASLSAEGTEVCDDNPGDADPSESLSDGADLFYNDLKEAGFINETSVNRDVAEHTDDDYIFAGYIADSAVSDDVEAYNVIVIAGVSRFLARAMDESIDGNADDMNGGRIRGIAGDSDDDGSVSGLESLSSDGSWSDWGGGSEDSPDDKVHVAYFFEDVPTD